MQTSTSTDILIDVQPARCSQDVLKAASTLFRALEHPVRLRVMLLLLERGALNVTSIADAVNIRRETLSRHLRCLREQKLISPRRAHKHIFYSVTPTEVARVQGIIDTLFKQA